MPQNSRRWQMLHLPPPLKDAFDKTGFIAFGALVHAMLVCKLWGCLPGSTEVGFFPEMIIRNQMP